MLSREHFLHAFKIGRARGSGRFEEAERLLMNARAHFASEVVEQIDVLADAIAAEEEKNAPAQG